MASNTNTRSTSHDRINIRSPQEVRTWAMSLGVSEQSLRQAVERSGNSVESVRSFLNGTSE